MGSLSENGNLLFSALCLLSLDSPQITVELPCPACHDLVTPHGLGGTPFGPQSTPAFEVDPPFHLDPSGLYLLCPTDDHLSSQYGLSTRRWWEDEYRPTDVYLYGWHLTRGSIKFQSVSSKRVIMGG